MASFFERWELDPPCTEAKISVIPPLMQHTRAVFLAKAEWKYLADTPGAPEVLSVQQSDTESKASGPWDRGAAT